MRDADFGMVRVRAFGTYTFRIADAETFLKEVVGTNWKYTTDEIVNQLRNYMVSGFAEAIAEAKMPVLDLYSHYDDMGESLTAMMAPKFAALGIEVVDLMIENVSVPPEVEQAIDTRSKMGAVGNLDNYAKFQAADAMVKGAENQGGMGGLGAQIAAGQIMGQMMTPQSQSVNPPATNATPPPVPKQPTFFMAVNGQQQGPYTMSQLKEHLADGSLTRDSLVWAEGMAEWKKASDVDALSELFGSTPPPVPPQ